MKKYSIGWGLTNTCNMNCQFCYSKETRHKIDEVTIEDWKRFVDENHEMIDSINYGTGENAIMDEFFEFVDYIRTNYPDITQSLTSNGYLYERVKNNPRYYNIYKRCIDEVDVSLDFNDRDKHGNFRGQPKAFDWAISTLDMLKKDGKKATIVFVGFNETLTKENLDGLFQIAGKFDALLRLNVYRPVTSVESINSRFIADYDQLKEAIEYIGDNYSIVSLSDILFGNLYTDVDNITENTGVDSIRILPNGDICPSTYLIDDEYRNKYSIKDKDVLSKIEFKDFINPPIPEECSECELRDKCKGGVFDRRILWNGTLEGRDPYCPFEHEDTLPEKHYKILKKNRVSVHDGYLPTMFFKNKEK